MINVTAAASRPAAAATSAVPLPLTQRTRELVPEPVLQRPIGTGGDTVGGALERSIRYRIEGDGPISERRLVPDTEVAARLLESKAGPKLERVVQTMLSGAEGFEHTTDIRGVSFSADTDAAAAASMLARLEELPGSRPSERQTVVAQRAAEDYSEGAVKRAGAWYRGGWVNYMPGVSRTVLTGIGAYSPQPGDEPKLRKAGSAESYLGPTFVHEMQHAVSPGWSSRAGWMEEGIAEALSDTPVLREQAIRQSGINRYSYAGHLGAPDHFSPGWQPWARPEMTDAERQALNDRAQRVYADSAGVVTGLVEMAGGDFETQEGIARSRQLLQGVDLAEVPGQLAKAIIAHNGLDPSVRSALEQRIVDAGSSSDSLARIRQEFLGG